MVLVDTSIWVDYLRGKETIETLYLSDLITESADICISGIILTEILQGIPDEKEFKRVNASLESLIFLPVLKSDHVTAAEIYRHARSRGQVIRNTIDCLIAVCAITHNVPLLHNDKDYLAIAKVSKLRLMELDKLA